MARLPLGSGHSTTHVRLQGIEKHGVGRWREIGEELLPRWDDTTLRLKTTRLLGSQSLARYIGWKGDRCRSIAHGQPSSYGHETLETPSATCRNHVCNRSNVCKAIAKQAAEVHQVHWA
jgi:hypothetical protein